MAGESRSGRYAESSLRFFVAVVKVRGAVLWL